MANDSKKVPSSEALRLRDARMTFIKKYGYDIVMKKIDKFGALAPHNEPEPTAEELDLWRAHHSELGLSVANESVANELVPRKPTDFWKRKRGLWAHERKVSKL